MTLPRTAAEVLSDHVRLEIRCTDRVLLTFRQPRLQYGQGIHGFFCHHRGNQFVSSTLMRPMTERFAADIRHYIDTRGLDLVRFAKGQSKNQVAKEYLAGHDGGECILFVGAAKEKARVWRTSRRRDPATGKRYPWLYQDQAMINHWYFYGFDADFGPFFIKFCGPAGLPGSKNALIAWAKSRKRLLLHRLGAGGQPRVFRPRGGELPALLQVARRARPAGVPVRVLLDGQVPYVPAVRAVVPQHRFLGGAGEQPVPGHANTLANTTDISGEVTRRWVWDKNVGDWPVTWPGRGGLVVRTAPDRFRLLACGRTAVARFLPSGRWLSGSAG